MTFEIEGFPHGIEVDADALRAFMERRAPGRDRLSTARRESDEVVFTKGVVGGVTDGGTIRGEIANRDMRPGDYGAERTVPRPGHADFGQWVEQGAIPSGGGKNSGRLTAPLCAAGALCLQWLAQRGISVSAHVDTIGGKAKGFEKTILAAKKSGDSVGGTIVCEARGLPAGLGGALFDGIESEISAAVFAVPGVKGIEFGNGFAAAAMRGSANDDSFVVKGGVVATKGNNHGGILGGRTSGMPLVFKVAMKPTPTVFKPLASVDLATMKAAECAMKGRHDPCIALRAVPVVEAVTAFAIADAILADEAAYSRICLTLTGKTLAEDIAQYESQRYFADMVELRVDLLAKEERAKVLEFPKMLAKSSPWKVPVVLTFRRACDGGAFKGKEKERVKFFKKTFSALHALHVLHGSKIDYVDFEDGFDDDALVALAHDAGAKVVRSLHDFKGPVPNLAARIFVVNASSPKWLVRRIVNTTKITTPPT